MTADRSVTFDASSSVDPEGGDLAFHWNFGDDAIGGQQSVTAIGKVQHHAFRYPGTYKVVLKVTDNGRLSATSSTTVVVGPEPRLNVGVPSSSPSVGSFVAGAPISASDTTQGDPVAWDWDFGDGTPHGTTREVTHTYSEPGNYQFNLHVKDSSGLAGDFGTYISVAPAPGAPSSPTIESTPSALPYQCIQVDVGSTVPFSATGSAGGTAPLEYSWEFSDVDNLGHHSNLSVASGPAVNHTFDTKSASVSVKLSVTDAAGRSATPAYQCITVQDPDRPVATYSHGGSDDYWTADLGSVVKFDASQSTHASDTDLTYEWDFGDGSTETGMIVEHTYSTTGHYEPALTVSDTLGRTARAQTYLTVVDPTLPVALVSPTPSYDLSCPVENCVQGAGPLTVALDASPTRDDDPSTLTYEWDFGDGSPHETGKSVQHVFPARESGGYFNVGAYEGRLTVTDADGNTSTSVFVVWSRDPSVPHAQIAQSRVPVPGASSNSFTFNAAGSFGGTGSFSFEWSVDGALVGESSSTLNVTFPAGEFHSVSVKVTDSDGHSSTAYSYAYSF